MCMFQQRVRMDQVMNHGVRCPGEILVVDIIIFSMQTAFCSSWVSSIKVGFCVSFPSRLIINYFPPHHTITYFSEAALEMHLLSMVATME